MRRYKNLHINKIYKEIEENSMNNSTKELYGGIRNLTKKFQFTTEIIKDKSGSTLCNGEGIKERLKQYCEDLYNTNYQKAFDTVDHKTLWKILLEMRFQQHFIHLIKELYSNQKATVGTVYGLTDFF